MKTKKQQFIWELRVLWYNKHNLITGFLNLILMFICDHKVGWKRKRGDDHVSHIGFCHTYNHSTFQEIKSTPRFGLVRIRKHKFLRDLFIDEDFRITFWKKRNGVLKFIGFRSFPFQLNRKVDWDFMKRAYIPFYQWYAYVKYAKDCAATEISNHVCLSDPMNGCPEDFAEDFGRQQHGEWVSAERLKVPYWFKSWVFNYYNNRAWEEYRKNPAPWDVEELDEKEMCFER